MNDQEKAKSKSVSLLPELWEKVEKRAEERFQGNRSRYIQSLIEADLNRGSDRAAHEEAKAEVILEHLAYKWRPDLAPKIIETIPAGLNQLEFLGVILAALPRYFDGRRMAQDANEMAAKAAPEPPPGIFLAHDRPEDTPRDVCIVPDFAADMLYSHTHIANEELLKSLPNKALAAVVMNVPTNYLARPSAHAMLRLERVMRETMGKRSEARGIIGKVSDAFRPSPKSADSTPPSRTETHHGSGKNSGNTNSGGGSQVVGDGAFVSAPGGGENEYLRAAKATRDTDAFLAAFPALKIEFARLLADRSIAAAEAVRRAAAFCGYPDGIPVALLTHLNKAAKKARNL